MPNNIKVSIIVPIYNSEKYLERCLKSILNQTLKDIEIILINDGSTDDSEKIIEKFYKNYTNIIKKATIKNAGVANARNIGLQMAEGEFIGFVDSDDYIKTDMYEKLYNKAKSENADIVVSAYITKNQKCEKIRKKGNVEQYNKSILENPNLFIYEVPYLWNKLFKRELIQSNNLKFDDLRIFEDLEFVYSLYVKANKISKVNEELYYYVKDNNNSLTFKFNNKFFDITKAIKKLKTYYFENNCYEKLEEYLIYIALKHIYIRCNMKIDFKSLKMKFDYINEVFKFMDKEFPNWKKHKMYFNITNKNQKKYTSKLYWKLKTIYKLKNKKRCK